MFPVPNLDQLSTDPEAYQRAAETFDLLKEFCQLKARHLALVKEGRMAYAAEVKKFMHVAHRELPDWAKWRKGSGNEGDGK